MALRGPAVVFVVVYCLLLLLIPSQLVVGALGAPGTPANLWGLAALFWWMLATLGGINSGHGRSPVRIAALVLALAVLASYAAAMAHGWYAPPDVHQSTDVVYDLVPTTAAELNERMTTAADRGLLSFGGWLGIVLLTADGLRSWSDLEVLVKWLTGAAAIVALLGIVQFYTGLDIASFFRIPGLTANSDFGAVNARSVLNRVSSTAVHPIEFGVVMAGILPLAINRTINDWRNISCWIPTVLIALAIPMSVSRSAVIATGVALIVLIIGWPPAWRRRALLLLPFVAVGLRFAAPGLIGTIVSLFTNLFDDPSITGRTQDYDVVFHLYSDHPWFGRGLFTFVPRYYRILDNQFLMSLVETGIVGLLITITFLGTGYFSARGAARRAKSPRNKYFALAVSACIAGVVTSYFTFDAWGFPMAAGLTFLMVGVAGAAWNISNRESELARTHKPTEGAFIGSEFARRASSSRGRHVQQ